MSDATAGSRQSSKGGAATHGWGALRADWVLAEPETQEVTLRYARPWELGQVKAFP